MQLVYEYVVEFIVGLADFFIFIFFPKKIKEKYKNSFWLIVLEIIVGLTIFFGIIALLIIWANQYN